MIKIDKSIAKQFIELRTNPKTKLTKVWFDGHKDSLIGRRITEAILAFSSFSTVEELLKKFEGFTIGELLTLNIE